jgi:glutathione synthase/RimK-type ligase-like ATP-grasp enzyme
MPKFMIIRSNRELKSQYDQLQRGDVFVGSLSSKHLKQTMLVDLLERGVICLPSALAQILNGSKIAQTFTLSRWMLPHTTVIYRRKDLMDAISNYAKQVIGSVITKQDHMHCGHGVRRWDNIETLYNYLAFSKSSYPFVLQPYVESFTDVRVIIIGDHIESYVRQNPYNFRSNIAAGGSSRPFALGADGKNICHEVMTRGKFPYAHIDLLVMDSGEYYLSEITLNGGTGGAKITRQELDQKKWEVLEDLISSPRSDTD